MDVRWAALQDEEQLSELWWRLQESHQEYEPRLYADHGEAACKALWRAHFRELFDEEDALIVVAASGGSLVGMVVGHLRNRPPIYVVPCVLNIDSTVVHPEHRRTGVFGSMLQFLEAAAKARGVNVVQLTVHKENEATEAYLRTGFERVTEGMVKWLDRE